MATRAFWTTLGLPRRLQPGSAVPRQPAAQMEGLATSGLLCQQCPWLVSMDAVWPAV